MLKCIRCISWILCITTVLVVVVRWHEPVARLYTDRFTVWSCAAHAVLDGAEDAPVYDWVMLNDFKNGRLGNKMFQYAALVGVALRLGRRPVVPVGVQHPLAMFPNVAIEWMERDGERKPQVFGCSTSPPHSGVRFM